MIYEPGDLVGPYRVTEVIGEGATGVVYRVVNSVTGRLEAMKILSEHFSRSREQARRFLQEIQVQAKLEHPNIAQVRTAFCEGNTLVLVMELVEGEPLNSVLGRGPLPLRSAVRVAGQVLDALALAHHNGVVHRDVKPANILVDRLGTVKLTDFGLAKRFGEPGQTDPGMAVGTVYYMAPEQVRGLAETDWRADLYSVGVLLYEMLTGRRPFEGVEQYAVMRAHVEQTHVPVTRLAPRLPKEVDALMDRALAKDPAQRFQSATGFLAALQALPEAAPTAGRGVWEYATYAAGIVSLLLAAFALPVPVTEEPLEELTLAMPVTPEPPEEAYRFTPQEPVAEREASVAAPVTPVRRAAPRRLGPAPESGRMKVPLDDEPAVIPVEAKIPARSGLATSAEASAPAAMRPAPRPVETPLPETAAAQPAARVEPVAEEEAQPAKRGRWLRRTFGKFPRVFRKADPEEKEPAQKP
jgi:eukaryotic-like serine/threonine-protein kinase